MKSVAMLLASAASAHALVTRHTQCQFHLNATGGPGGPVRQLGDGQNRIGQKGLPQGQYSIGADGGLTDSHGRGCILTPPTTQWQCDAGDKPTTGFSLSASGALEFHSGTKFFACPTGNHGGYNIYSQPLAGEPGCITIGLTADNCASSSPGSPSSSASKAGPSPSSQSSASSPSKSSAPGSPAPSGGPLPPIHSGTPSSGPGSCPLKLPGGFEFPHLIVPVNEDQGDKSYGTSFNGTAMGDLSSIFDFDIPMSMSGKQCQLQFALPTQNELETSAYAMSGEAFFAFYMLAAAAEETTTFNTMAKVTETFGVFAFIGGFDYHIAQFPCPAGEAIGIKMSAVANSQINYFQDSNPCPIGLYITPV